jgi:biotin synthase-like enzyme
MVVYLKAERLDKMLDHITARLVAGGMTILCLATLLGTTGFRNAELAAAARAKTIANNRIGMPEAKISATPIVTGEEALMLGTDGTPQPIAAGQVMITAEGVTSKTKATTNGLGKITITHQDVYAGSQETATSVIAGRISRLKELSK